MTPTTTGRRAIQPSETAPALNDGGHVPDHLNGDAHGFGALSEERWRGWVDARLADILRRLDDLSAQEATCQEALKDKIDVVEARVEQLEKLVENWKGKVYFGALGLGVLGALIARIAVFFMEHITQGGVTP